MTDQLVHPTDSFTFPGPNVNPFKCIRQALGYTQVELANRVGITKHAVIRAEQGMAVDPPPTLLNYCVDNFTVSRIAIINQYETFQVHTRTANHRILEHRNGLRDSALSFTDLLTNYYDSAQSHPLSYLLNVSNHNPTSFAKGLCINQTVVAYFLKHPAQQQTVPEQILSALKENGYTNTELKLFQMRYAEYRERFIKYRDVHYDHS